MDAGRNADLLLLATVGVFILLTFIAYLFNEGKPVLVEPALYKVRKSCTVLTESCRGKNCNEEAV